MVDNTQRDALIVQMAREGASFKTISQAFGISASHACTIAKRAGLSRRIVGVTACAVPGCDRPYESSGFCSVHYQRQRRLGALDLPPKSEFDRADYEKTWRMENPDKVWEYTSRYRAKNPEKRRAHRKIEVEIRTGRMVRQPCEVCGAVKSQAHHDDYTRPLDILWLCARHHKGRHRYLERQQLDPDV